MLSMIAAVGSACKWHTMENSPVLLPDGSHQFLGKLILGKLRGGRCRHSPLPEMHLARGSSIAESSYRMIWKPIRLTRIMRYALIAGLFR